MDTQWAEKFKILADPTRLSVIGLLLESPRTAGDLCRIIDVEQTLMSHHLKVLRDGEFVNAQREGKHVVYSLRPGLNCSATGPAIDLGCCKIAFQSSSETRKDTK